MKRYLQHPALWWHRPLLWILVALAVYETLDAIRSLPSPREQWIAREHSLGHKVTLADLGVPRRTRFNALNDYLALTDGDFATLDGGDPIGQGSSPLQAEHGLQLVLWEEPGLFSSRRTRQEWAALESAVDRIDPLARELRGLLDEAAPAGGGRIRAGDETLWGISKLGPRLHTLVMVELHRGNRDQADLSLLLLLRAGRADNGVRGFRDLDQRGRLLELAADAIWQALQAPGWSEARLARWQAESERLALVSGLEQGFAHERAYLDEVFEEQMVQPQSRQLQPYLAAWRVGAAGRCASYAGSQMWRLFYSGRDRLAFLEGYTRCMHASGALARGQPYAPEDFSFQMPGYGLPGRILGWMEPRMTNIVFPFSGRLSLGSHVAQVFSAETRVQIAITALALERHRLRHGRRAQRLEDLVPAFLPAVPRDPWHHALLRYVPLSDDQPLLYSIGRNGRDESVHPDGSARASVLRGDDAEFAWPRPLVLQRYPAGPPPWALDAKNRVEAGGRQVRRVPTDEVVPVIAFEDCPVQDALRALASQAGITLVVVDAGQLPNLNLRLEGVKAFQALGAVAKNYTLLLEQEPMTGVYRVRRP